MCCIGGQGFACLWVRCGSTFKSANGRPASFVLFKQRQLRGKALCCQGQTLPLGSSVKQLERQGGNRLLPLLGAMACRTVHRISPCARPAKCSQSSFCLRTFGELAEGDRSGRGALLWLQSWLPGDFPSSISVVQPPARSAQWWNGVTRAIQCGHVPSRRLAEIPSPFTSLERQILSFLWICNHALKRTRWGELQLVAAIYHTCTRDFHALWSIVHDRRWDWGIFVTSKARTLSCLCVLESLE